MGTAEETGQTPYVKESPPEALPPEHLEEAPQPEKEIPNKAIRKKLPLFDEEV